MVTVCYGDCVLVHWGVQHEDPACLSCDQLVPLRGRGVSLCAFDTFDDVATRLTPPPTVVPGGQPLSRGGTTTVARHRTEDCRLLLEVENDRTGRRKDGKVSGSASVRGVGVARARRTTRQQEQQ